MSNVFTRHEQTYLQLQSTYAKNSEKEASLLKQRLAILSWELLSFLGWFWLCVHLVLRT